MRLIPFHFLGRAPLLLTRMQSAEPRIHSIEIGQRAEGGEGGGMDVLHADKSLFFPKFSTGKYCTK